MKVLLLTSRSDFSDMYFATAPPVGLYRLKHYLQIHGIECDVTDLDFYREKEPYCHAMVAKGEYDIIGLSVSHQNMASDLDNLWQLKELSKQTDKRIIFIAGGQEATLNYSQWLEVGIDLVLTGFAEKTLYALCASIVKSPDISLEHLTSTIPGTAGINAQGHAVFNNAEKMSPDLFRELSFTRLLETEIPYNDYWISLRKESDKLNFNDNIFIPETVRLYTSSHCPRKCGFCSSHSFVPMSQGSSAKVTTLLAEEVFELVKHYTDSYGARGFLFSDDDLLLDKKRIIDFCSKIVKAKKEGIMDPHVVFNCQCHVSNFFTRITGTRQLDTELMTYLKQANFHSFGLGIETFSDQLLQSPSIYKSGICEKDCHSVLAALREHGLVPTINIIALIPEATVEEMVYSFRISTEYILKGYQVAVTPLMYAFSGAPIFDTKQYPYKLKIWENPYTNDCVKITDWLIPHDKRLADVAHIIKDAEVAETEAFKKKYDWQGDALPKPVSALCIFSTIMRLLGEQDQCDYFAWAIDEIMSKACTGEKSG
jgi:radical SAM superfamily enzyme YgiQ (UPF0313 family)